MYTFKDVGDAQGTQLLGNGTKLTDAARQAAVAAVVKHFREWRPAG
jgi:hypothetical protein